MQKTIKIILNILTIGIPLVIDYVVKAIKIAKKVIDKFKQNMDFNNDGKISFKEFLNFLDNDQIDIKEK